MPIVTFTSDFGNGDHYVAAVKAAILGKSPEIQMVDLSHDIQPFDIAHLAFVVKAVYRQFPAGTIHLIGLNDTNRSGDTYLAVELEEQVLLLPDNGMVGLLSDQQPTKVVKLDSEKQSLFPTLDLLAPIAQKLATGSQITEFGQETAEFNRMITRQVKATRREIAGHVIRIDQYGNLITNIKKVDFDILSKDKQYSILVGRETARRVHQKYQDVDPGDLFLVFNSLGLLEIGINQGNAHQLLGLNFDAPVNIQFEE